jgi:hypothetical protein
VGAKLSIVAAKLKIEGVPVDSRSGAAEIAIADTLAEANKHGGAGAKQQLGKAIEAGHALWRAQPAHGPAGRAELAT